MDAIEDILAFTEASLRVVARPVIGAVELQIRADDGTTECVVLAPTQAAWLAEELVEVARTVAETD